MFESNPYAPPNAEPSGVQPEAVKYDVAATGKRFGNLILDNIFALLFAGLIGVVMALIGQAKLLDKVNDRGDPAIRPNSAF